MNPLERVSDFTDVFLREVYSEGSGWSCFEYPAIGEFVPDFIFERVENDFCEIIVRVPDPMIKEHHIDHAEGLLAVFNSKFPQKEARLLLVCAQLLVDPPKLPSNILAVSIFEEAFGCHDTNISRPILN